MIRFWPPSSSGLGRRPFTAVARVRIPLGVRDAVTRSSSKALWRSWLARRPVTAEVAGASPDRVAKRGEAFAALRPGSSVGTSVRLKSGRSAVRSRPWPPALSCSDAVTAPYEWSVLSDSYPFALLLAASWEPIEVRGLVLESSSE